MSVTLKYEDGHAAIYADLDAARDQAAHDRDVGYVPPALIAEGDLSETHAGWAADAPYQDVKVIDDLSDLPPHDCVECELRRRTFDWDENSGAQKHQLRQRLETAHQWRLQHDDDRTLAELVE